MKTLCLLRKIFFFFFLFLLSFSSISAETIKILAIGNSFSEDAIENYLYDLGKADSVTLIIGNLYIGGCSLERHWTNASGDLGVYSYRKIDMSGLKTTTEKISIKQAVTDEDWDYISFQQVSQNSGMYDTYFPYLTDLLNYVKLLATNPNVKYVFHSTWAYAKNSTHSGFANYGNNQNTMYAAIIDASFRAAKTAGINIVIPSGTAVQNGRTSIVGDNYCRDGFHLNNEIGRYTVACTWYEKLTGKLVIGNTFIPSNITPSMIRIAQEAAHYAVQTPMGVTDMSSKK